MNAILENIIHTGVVRSHLDRPLEVHSGIQVEEGQLLQEIISDIKPKVSLEVGLAYGISSLFICEALDKTARHILIDPDQFGDTWQGIGLLNLEKAGYKEQIEFYAEPSHVVLPRLRARGLEIDFAFIDGFHTFDHGMVDFFYIDTLLKENAIVVFDDVSYPSIHKVIRFILTNRSYRVYRCLEYSGRPNELSLRHRAALHVGRLKPAKLLMKPELSIPDSALGFSAFTTCVALRKVAEDTRSFSFHREF